MIKTLRQYENLHILLWLIKDTCWLLDYKYFGMFMAIPTIGVALHITWLSRKKRAELLHNIAVSSWICANITWMIGEFFYDDTTRPIAAIFFAVGLLSVFYYYLYLVPFKKEHRKTDEVN